MQIRLNDVWRVIEDGELFVLQQDISRNVVNPHWRSVRSHGFKATLLNDVQCYCGLIDPDAQMQLDALPDRNDEK